MKEVYARVTKIARHNLYQFMKDNRISPLNYLFDYYFDSYVEIMVKFWIIPFPNVRLRG